MRRRVILKSCDSPRRSASRFYVFVALCLLAALACSRADAPIDYGHVTPIGGATPFAAGATPRSPGDPTATLAAASLPVPDVATHTPRPTQDTSSSPTPDAARPSALDRQQVEHYTVQRSDTLGDIGVRYGVTAVQIADSNGIKVTDTLRVGQVLLIPLPEGQARGPDVKLLPDSEFVYGPGAINFNVSAFVESQRGYLASYTEDIPGVYIDNVVSSATLTGSAIVQLVAQRYSINPKLLLALLEYQSGWVTQPHPGDNTLTYPLGQVEVRREGLLRQLSWAANELNRGYYLWRAGGVGSLGFADGSIKIISPGLNAGTVGVQHFFSKVLGPDVWTHAVSPEGLASVYQAMFGNPFALAFEPLIPANLIQPALSLPFESGKTWAFTGGPHGAWDTGSAWAALDFAPPAEAQGCTLSDEWVTAAAPGLIVRSQYGAVLEDLDNDGDEGTGWVLFYMHIESRDRIEVGARVAAGDHLGHPSCEGGVANGTHVHFARKYNGEWIPADGPIPFVLEGWVSSGLGKEYDGTLTRGVEEIEACDCRAASNEISRP
jgi:LasA protease